MLPPNQIQNKKNNIYLVNDINKLMELINIYIKNQLSNQSDTKEDYSIGTYDEIVDTGLFLSERYGLDYNILMELIDEISNINQQDNTIT